MEEKITRLLQAVDDSEQELVELHQALVRIPSVNTGAPASGNEVEVCRLLAERFQREGIASQILSSAPGRGNLLASYGDANGPRFLLMSHVDVVPVEDEESWQYPPFGAEIADGKIFGRGSDDAKSLVSTGAMALILLKRLGISLDGEVRFLAAADEEAGGKYGIAWLAANHPDEIRADWAINEGGGLPLSTAGKLAYPVAVGEKGRLEARFTIGGQSGHAASPWKVNNPLDTVGSLLQRIRNYRPQLDVRLPFFDHLQHFGVAERPTAENVEEVLQQLAQEDKALASLGMALSRMTLTPTMASGGVKSNSIPAAASLVCDIRTLPHQDESYVRGELTPLIADLDGVDLEVTVSAEANASPFSSPFVTRLQRATELVLGRSDMAWLPIATVGFTDSRHVRPLGTEVYGFSPLTPGSDTIRPGVHGVDEAMEIENLIFRTKVNMVLAYLALGGA